jgi:hypothetical protein
MGTCELILSSQTAAPVTFDSRPDPALDKRYPPICVLAGIEFWCGVLIPIGLI